MLIASVMLAISVFEGTRERIEYRVQDLEGSKRAAVQSAGDDGNSRSVVDE
jgi:hypothetical protein